VVAPGRGLAGGDLVFNGPLDALLKRTTKSLTADYLTGRKLIPVPRRRRAPKAFELTLYRD
jgi:excinuclease ABC subunit A